MHINVIDVMANIKKWRSYDILKLIVHARFVVLEYHMLYSSNNTQMGISTSSREWVITRVPCIEIS